MDVTRARKEKNNYQIRMCYLYSLKIILSTVFDREREIFYREKLHKLS